MSDSIRLVIKVRGQEMSFQLPWGVDPQEAIQAIINLLPDEPEEAPDSEESDMDWERYGDE